MRCTSKLHWSRTFRLLKMWPKCFLSNLGWIEAIVIQMIWNATEKSNLYLYSPLQQHSMVICGSFSCIQGCYNPLLSAMFTVFAVRLYFSCLSYLGSQSEDNKFMVNYTICVYLKEISGPKLKYYLSQCYIIFNWICKISK